MVGYLSNPVQLFVYLGIFFVLGCGGRNDLTERCASDSDCASGECLGNICAAPQPCVTSQECSEGFVCNSGGCIRGEEDSVYQRIFLKDI